VTKSGSPKIQPFLQDSAVHVAVERQSVIGKAFFANVQMMSGKIHVWTFSHYSRAPLMAFN
jgi:hypothetical protein